MLLKRVITATTTEYHIMLMGFKYISHMNKHEVQSNFVRFGIYFNRKLCLKLIN